MISCRGKRISLRLLQQVIRIIADEELAQVLATDTEAATTELVTAIKTAYRMRYNHDFQVSDASFAVEIWGHVYADKFADIIKQLSPFGWIDKIADKVIYHCAIIDIGEEGHDDNRFVWDRLAPFANTIARMLPQPPGKENEPLR